VTIRVWPGRRQRVAVQPAQRPSAGRPLADRLVDQGAGGVGRDADLKSPLVMTDDGGMSNTSQTAATCTCGANGAKPRFRIPLLFGGLIFCVALCVAIRVGVFVVHGY
jgi:hypothetical protein